MVGVLHGLLLLVGQVVALGRDDGRLRALEPDAAAVAGELLAQFAEFDLGTVGVGDVAGLVDGDGQVLDPGDGARGVAVLVPQVVVLLARRGLHPQVDEGDAVGARRHHRAVLHVLGLREVGAVVDVAVGGVVVPAEGSEAGADRVVDGPEDLVLDLVVDLAVDVDAILVRVVAAGARTGVHGPGAVGGEAALEQVVALGHLPVLLVGRRQFKDHVAGGKLLVQVLEVERAQEVEGVRELGAIAVAHLGSVHLVDEHRRLEGFGIEVEVVTHLRAEIIGRDGGAFDRQLHGQDVGLAGLGREALEVHAEEVSVQGRVVHAEQAVAGAGQGLAGVGHGELGAVQAFELRRGEEGDGSSVVAHDDEVVTVLGNEDEGIDRSGGSLRNRVGLSVHRDDKGVGRLLDSHGGAAGGRRGDGDRLAVAEGERPDTVRLGGIENGRSRHHGVLDVLLGLVPGPFEGGHPLVDVVVLAIVAGRDDGQRHR